MAKAKEIVGIDCGASALEWAATVLRVRFEEMTELREAALDFDNIEGVHQMRVATRRLRSALRDFLPLMDKRPLKKTRGELKRIADALGRVRDRDVAILALEGLQLEAENETVKRGVEALLEERRRARETARTGLTETIAVNNLADLQERFTAALGESVRKKKQRRDLSFNEAGRAAVTAGLREMCELGISLYQPQEVEELHELRIAAKRLRYAVELFTACWGERIAPFADEVAEMQAHLGEVHDSDVWIADLSKKLRAVQCGSQENQSEYQASVWLLSEFVKKRTKNYRAALELWSEWQNQNFADKMQTVVSQ